MLLFLKIWRRKKSWEVNFSNDFFVVVEVVKFICNVNLFIMWNNFKIIYINNWGLNRLEFKYYFCFMLVS